MNNSVLKITFIDDPENGDYLSFDRGKSGVIVLQKETFIDGVRSDNYQIGIKPPNASMPGLYAAVEFERLFDLDYNDTGLYIISRVDNVVSLEILDGWDFNNFQSTGFATAQIINRSEPSYTIVDWEAVQSDMDECDTIAFEIRTSLPTDKTFVNGEEIPGGYGSFLYIRVPRNVRINSFILEHASGARISFLPQVINSPSSIIWMNPYWFIRRTYPENINIAVTFNPIGGSLAIVSVSYPGQLSSYPQLSLEYSLDGINWSPSRRFSGLENGSYTLYVRDSFGCLITKDFEVTERGSNELFINIPKLNSVTFSKNETWGNYSPYKNDTNVLSETDIADLNYKESLLFLREDEIEIQFRSNYDTLEAKLETCIGGNDVSYQLPLIKYSQNMNRFESLDCYIYQYNENTTGVYFTSGNVYDENRNVIGQFNLNGNLPGFAIIGQYVRLTYPGPIRIKDVLFDSNINKWVILLDWIIYNQTPVSDVIISNYNLLDFEVYQFKVNFNHYPLGDVSRLVISGYSGSKKESHYSEDIVILPDVEDTVAISYFNKENNAIFYEYGIRHFIRVRLETVYAFIKDSSEYYTGDNEGALYKTELYDGNVFEFQPVTRDLFLKLSLALSSSFLFINGVGYFKSENLEHENIKGTNLYIIKANLLKTNTNINSISANKLTAHAPAVYIPNVIASGVGLIKIK